MPTRLLKTVTLLALTALSTLALADPPARVGRVALAQGQVSISADVGEESNPALVNWPLTSRNLVTTAANSRTDLRVGSTSIRLDGDSSLEVVELDDDSLRLRLHYGSASVRIVNADVLPGFELATAQARVRMQQPGRLRVDAERVRDTSAVNVFDGVALVDGGGSTLTIRAGRRAVLQDDDVRTGQATTDAFDDWSLGRDRYGERSTAARYVTTEMTGYEDLDRYGSWRTDSEYGPLWLPSVSSSWVPYRDGRWTWLDPWGWTWVDNAPWGYAPFHYGRWVHVNKRWAWAPGRHDRHPVWAPALVGWIGGSGWSLAFDGRSRRAAQGWYPLSPRDRFVPGYRTSDEHVKRLNNHGRHGGSDGRRDGDRERDQHRRDGLTVVPHDQFGHRGGVVVPRASKLVPPPLALQNAPGIATPGVAPAGPRRGEARPDTRPHRVGREQDDRGRDGRDGSDRADRDVRYGRDRRERDGHDGGDRAGQDRGDRDRSTRGQPGSIVMPPPVVAAAPAAVPAPQVRPQPAVAVQAPPQVQLESQVPRWQQRHDGRGAPDEGRRFRRLETPVQQSPVVVPPPPVFAPSNPVVVPPPPVFAPSTPQFVAPQPPAPAQPDGRFNRGHRGDGDGERRQRDYNGERRQRDYDGGERRQRDYNGGAAQVHPAAPPPMAAPMAAPVMAPPRMVAPPPQMVAQPMPAPRPAPEPVRAAPPAPVAAPAAAPARAERPQQEDRARGGERRRGGEDRQMREERR
jgi:hypothetical protein